MTVSAEYDTIPLASSDDHTAKWRG